MSESFSVGEIAIFVKPGSDCYGLELTITGPAEVIHDWRSTINGKLCYPISAPWSKRREGYAAVPVEHLRKRRPPQDWKSLCNLTDVPREVTCA